MEESSTFKKKFFLGENFERMWKVIFKEIYKRKVLFYCIVRSENYAATKTRRGGGGPIFSSIGYLNWGKKMWWKWCRQVGAQTIRATMSIWVEELM